MRERALIWDIDVEAVEWADGEARPAGPNTGEFEPLTLKDIAGKHLRRAGQSEREVRRCRRDRLWDAYRRR